MTRKRFIKLLMGQRVPRNISTEVARRVAATGAPYSAVKIIFARPRFDDFYIKIFFEQVAHLNPKNFIESMEDIRGVLEKARQQPSGFARLYLQMKPDMAKGGDFTNTNAINNKVTWASV